MRRPSPRRRTWSTAGKGYSIRMKGGTLSATLLQTKVVEIKKNKNKCCAEPRSFRIAKSGGSLAGH